MKRTILATLFMALPLLTFAQDEQEVHRFMDAWHQAAANANATVFFGSMDEEAVYVGTDASEVWPKEAFVKFAKPYFDKGKAWSFQSIKRNVYFSEDNKTAWFDETLDTWMGVCRGSGILKKQGRDWKVKHFVLSVTVPNEKIGSFIKLVQEDTGKEQGNR